MCINYHYVKRKCIVKSVWYFLLYRTKCDKVLPPTVKWLRKGALYRTQVEKINYLLVFVSKFSKAFKIKMYWPTTRITYGLVILIKYIFFNIKYSTMFQIFSKWNHCANYNWIFQLEKLYDFSGFWTISIIIKLTMTFNLFFSSKVKWFGFTVF